MHLVAPQILSRCRLRRTAEELHKVLDMADIVVLRLLAEAADGHVLQHAAAQIADGLLDYRVLHRGLLSEEWSAEPLDPQDRPHGPLSLPCRLVTSRSPNPADRAQRTPAVAGSFTGPDRHFVAARDDGRSRTYRVGLDEIPANCSRSEALRTWIEYGSSPHLTHKRLCARAQHSRCKICRRAGNDVVRRSERRLIANQHRWPLTPRARLRSIRREGPIASGRSMLMLA